MNRHSSRATHSPRFKRSFPFLSVALAAAVAAVAFSLLPVQAHSDAEHGKVSFETACDKSTRQTVEKGLGMLHHMMYQKAEEIFQQAAEKDENCAIAHWGVAMTQIHPLWGEAPSKEAFDTAHKAIQKAQQANNKNKRETAYVETLAQVFDEKNKADYQAQLKAYEKGFEKIHQRWPDDIDAAAFYALGQLANVDKSDSSLSGQKQAGKLLEELHAKAPEHPGLFHYIIHAYDHPRLAEKAIDVARAYDKVAPEVPHALHMPTHIFVRQGLWQDVIDWNKRSAEAALRNPAGEDTSLHYPHALDYLTYAYLQQGQVDKAKSVLEDLAAVESFQPSFASAYAIAAIPARFELERGEWQAAADLTVPAATNIEWQKFPHAAANIHYAKGIGAARAGNIEAAKQAHAALTQDRIQLEQMGENYWAQLTAAQAHAVEAWIALTQGERKKAMQTMRLAAKQEDQLDKHPVTPGSVIPARELLGDLMLELNQPAMALQAYEQNLELSPNRSRSLFGAAQSADQVGNRDKAKQYYTQLLENMEAADENYALVEQARMQVETQQTVK